MHALSYSDPVFQSVFVSVKVPRDRQWCQECHAPVSAQVRDYDLKQPISREGVTCDYCHSVTQALPGDTSAGRIRLQVGDVKRGPFPPEELTEKGHKNAHSPLHLKAEFCGACHEVVNRHGFHVMSTYSEWKQGSYAGSGIACQNCHMPEDIRFPIVDAHVVPTTKTVTSHASLGGHSQIRVGNAATISVLAERTAAGAEAVVYVTNSESGHSLPTGIPARKLLLTVTLSDANGKPVRSQELEYRRAIADTTGKEITNDRIDEMFLNAARVLSDNRIAPKETRREIIHFEPPLPEEGATVEAKLQYVFLPPLPGGAGMRFLMAAATAELKARTAPVWRQGGAVAALLVAVGFLTWLALRRRRTTGGGTA